MNLSGGGLLEQSAVPWGEYRSYLFIFRDFGPITLNLVLASAKIR